MNGLILRFMTWAVVLGLALAGPGLPVAWAQVDLGEVRAVLDADPDVRAIPGLESACRELVEAATRGEYNVEEAAMADRYFEDIQTQGIAAAPVATKMQLADAQAVAMMASGNYAGASQVTTDARRVGELYAAVSGGVTGGPPTEAMVAQGERMGFTPEQVRAMTEMAASARTDGAPTEQALEAMRECGLMTEAELAFAKEGLAQWEATANDPAARQAMMQEMASHMPTMDPATMEQMARDMATHTTSGMTVDQMREMAAATGYQAEFEKWASEQTTTSTSDTPRTESSGASETQFSSGHRMCRQDEAAEGAEHIGHGHTGCVDP